MRMVKLFTGSSKITSQKGRTTGFKLGLAIALLVLTLGSAFIVTKSASAADPVADAETALLKQGWYVSPGVVQNSNATQQQQQVKQLQQTLQNTVNDLKGKKHPAVLALLDPNAVKSGFRTAESYAEYLRTYITPNPDIVVVAVIPPAGQGTPGVALAADKLSQQEQQDITNATRSTFTKGDWAGAMQRIADGAEKKISDKETGGLITTLVIVVVVIVAIGIGLFFLYTNTKKSWANQLQSLRDLNSKVSDLTVRVGDSIDYLPDPQKNQVRNQFGQATANMSETNSNIRELEGATPWQVLLGGGKYRQKLNNTGSQLQASYNMLQQLDRAVEKI